MSADRPGDCSTRRLASRLCMSSPDAESDHRQFSDGRRRLARLDSSFTSGFHVDFSGYFCPAATQTFSWERLLWVRRSLSSDIDASDAGARASVRERLVPPADRAARTSHCAFVQPHGHRAGTVSARQSIPHGSAGRVVSTGQQPQSDLVARPVHQSQLQYWGVSGATLAGQWQNLTAVPPLAWSEALYDAAHDHNLRHVGP